MQSMKHVMRELKSARSSEKLEQLGVEVGLVDDGDMSKWRVVYILSADLRKHKQRNAVEIQIVFTARGFEEPPFVWVVGCVVSCVVCCVVLYCVVFFIFEFKIHIHFYAYMYTCHDMSCAIQPTICLSYRPCDHRRQHLHRDTHSPRLGQMQSADDS